MRIRRDRRSNEIFGNTATLEWITHPETGEELLYNVVIEIQAWFQNIAVKMGYNNKYYFSEFFKVEVPISSDWEDFNENWWSYELIGNEVARALDEFLYNYGVKIDQVEYDRYQKDGEFLYIKYSTGDFGEYKEYFDFDERVETLKVIHTDARMTDEDILRLF